jgi:lysophospholipase L1-like esterase
MRSRQLVCLGLFFVFSSAIAFQDLARGATEEPTTAVQRRKVGWLDQHKKLVERVKKGNVDLIFIGDSITEAWNDAASEGGWPGSPREMWQKYYGKRNAVNLGLSGDQTQHILWRLEHGEIDGIAPKLAVILIGTNNVKPARHAPEAIAAGIAKIVRTLRQKTPETKVLVMAVFPRNKEKTDPLRKEINEVNERIAKLDDGKMVFYRDIGEKFLDKDGTLREELLFDYVHLTAKGFDVWAEAIEPDVVKLMGETVEKK